MIAHTHSEAHGKQDADDAMTPTSREAVCLTLIDQLTTLRTFLLDREVAMQAELSHVAPQFMGSARNLVHYLALRVHDLRALQEQLAWLGLSSLGRSESHVLANLDKVLGILHTLTGQEWVDKSPDEPAGSVSSRRLLEQHSADLLGPCPAERPVRIMVTLPSEAATDASVARALVSAGMDIARINCAHDGPDDWAAMAKNVRRAAKSEHRSVRILMDLAGPKIRTGDIAARPAVLRMRPARDDYGRPLRPYQLGLRPHDSTYTPPGVDGCIGVDAKWLNHLKTGTQIDFTDARGAKRHLLVVRREKAAAVAQSIPSAYLMPTTVLSIRNTEGKNKRTTQPSQIASPPGSLELHQGDVIRVTRDGVGGDYDTAHIACTLPQVFEQVHPGERIWFDDGRIGGVIRRTDPDGMEVEIVHAREGGEKLRADKGINLPDSTLSLPALTEKDREDLQSVAQIADMVGLSFVQQAADVHLLRKHLDQMQRSDIGIVLKIETIKGFENLPELVLAALSGGGAGIMIARGDLAVECGYERLAEVQEEILWCAEAAHMPVIWATQVLETLAKTGVPSRAEISDAGLGVRAECVMLNKGPHIEEAIHTLDGILRRMVGHQTKKRSLLRALHSWT